MFLPFNGSRNKKEVIYDDKEFKEWKKRWKKRLLINNNPEKFSKLMRVTNPKVIPRNHKIEEVLESANQKNFEPFKNFLEVLKKPYNNQNGIQEYQSLNISKRKYQTFCGT